ncbi:sporulation-specific protein 15 isoform X3 [Drosophila mauritiana]|uniref:Sporulation-specific protein 15 isoform X3 n=1 Tax=Drosophila mauritiana TaxID=7226 RepID=A0A6P8KZK6_DROMA|nr:sporulation-specific protein 15 isoform X3 [Drosophila mauritiana]
MDTRSWRKVLLQWIGKCQFIEPNYISLEQSDLDSFFSVFIRKIQETQSDKGKELQDQPTKPIPLVQEFLAHNYPEFIVHQDDKEQPLDCLYVYTLLLHYSCVKKPSLFFHNICNNLPEMTQTCIASFFGETVDRLLTREYLSQSIANVAIIYQQGTQTSVSPCLPSSSLSPDPRSDDAQCPSTPSSSSSQPSSSTPQLHNHRERLRLQMSGSEMPPPSTPKTELLEQRTKELRGIRAQLEVVRYEKTVLEEQQLEKDELIKVLSKEKMMAKMELERLKNVKLNEEPHDNESHIMPYEFEHMKGNLLKEIGLKENLITEITDKLHDLRVEKSELSEKLNLAGKQLLEYTDRIRLLESRVEELTRSVSSRDDRIFFLELDNQELDQCLKEARDELKNRREVLNASSDLLDCSLSPNTTPENLASSVIDKQLREKEHENAELKEKLQYLHTSQRELCQALSSFLQKHNIDHEFPVEWTSSSLLSTISAIESTFVNTVEKSTQMKKECDVQAVCVEKLLEKCKLLYRSLGCQPQELDAFKATIAEPMESVFESSRECETILGCCHMRVVDIALKNNHLELDNERLNENCAELKSIIDRGDQHLADINLQLTEKEKQIKDVAAEIQELRKRNINLENMLSQIADKEASAASHAQRLQQCVKLMRAKYEVCRNELIAKNAAQDELVRMMVVPDWETLHGRVRQLIDLERRHVELNEMYRGMLKELDELSAKHDKLTHSHVEFVKRTEIELERKNAQLMAFEKHNNHFDCFLTRIFTLLRSRNGPKSTTMCSANTSIESMRIEQRFENIEKLIEGQLLSADTLKKELDDLRAKNEELSTENINAIIKRKKFVDSLEVNSEKVKQYITDLEKEAFSKNEKVAQLENTLSEEQSNARQLALRLDMAQQEVNDYYVEATRFINTVMDRIHEDFNGENHPQTLGNCMTKFLRIFDQMEVWYEDSSSLVEKLLHTRDELKKKLKASDEKMAKVMETYEEQIKALQAECDMEAKKNEHLEANRNAVMDTKDRRCQNFDKQDSSTDELFSVQGKLQKEQEITAQLKEDTLEKLQAKLQEGQQLVDSQKVELDKERKELAQVKSAFETQIKLSDDLQREKESAQQLVDSQKVELDKERKELAQVKSAFETQTKLSDDLQREKESAQQLVDNLKVELDKGQKELAQVKTAFEAQTKLSDDLQREKESAQQLVDNLKVELDKGQKELAQVKTAFEAQTKLSDDLQREKESAQQLVDNLKVELDKERKELAQVKSAFETQIKLSDDLQRENESAQRLVDNLKVELDKGQKELAQVKTAFEAQTKLSDDLQREKESAQQLVDSQKVELDKERKELAQVKSAFETQIKLSDDLQRENESAQRLVDNLKVELDKGQKELAQVKTAFEAQTKLSDDLQREKESAQREIFLVKERLRKEKREFEVELATLEDMIETLEEGRTQMEAERAAAYERINQLEARCQENNNANSELQVQTFKLECLQHQLKSEVGSCNSLVEDLNRKLADNVSKLDDAQSRLKTEIDEHNQVKEQLAHIADIPEVVELRNCLEAVTAQREEAQEKLAVVTSLLGRSNQEKLKMEEKACEVGNKNAELLELVEFYRYRVEAIERLLLASNQELEELKTNQAEGARDLGDTYSTSDGRQTETDQDKERNNKLALDCKILQAKYRDAKDEIKRCEKKIKDQRLEMEGKLEKMKNKMRSLYTAEVTRMKEKQERDAAKSASELEALTAQNAKYEEHTRKLSTQIVRLNEKILEQQKQHAIISTKLRHLQMQPIISETKPSSTTLTVSSSSSAPNDDWQPFKRPNVPSSNLAMEDEEGEVFNNTYLTDLKLGRVPADMTAEELIYRNSLQPPHLKSTYAAQYDLGSQDEDLKDGPHSLDDSMSALLSSSSTGTRKKSMGTHYKRPGPPTPSKNGGRLSFGSSEPPREILREFGDHNNTSKTPARFKFLTQRFSVGSSGLPRDELPRRKRPNLLTGTHRRRLRHAVDIFCTSTPRKSRSYYDQQRLIGASDAEKSEAVETEDEVIEVEPDAVPELEPLEDADQEGTPHLSTAALLALTKGNTRRLTGTTKPKKRRVSLSNHGNIFAKSRPASFVAGKRVQLRRKLRRDRMMGRFDEARHLDQVRLSHSVQAPESPENNNYSLHNRNEEEHLPSEILMGKTVVLVGKSRVSPVVSTTFNVEERSGTSLLQQQFEHENCVTWATHGSESVMMEETQNDWYFEQLCQETESTAPFQLQPLEYKPLDEEPAEPKLTQLVAASCSNITANSCATNMTGASSCTVYSMGSVHMQPLPQINITYVQQPPDSQQRRPARHRSLMAQCRRFLRHLSLGERLVMGFALLVMVGLSLHLADKLVLVISGILSGMGLVFLTYSCPGRN